MDDDRLNTIERKIDLLQACVDKLIYMEEKHNQEEFIMDVCANILADMLYDESYGNPPFDK